MPPSTSPCILSTIFGFFIDLIIQPRRLVTENLNLQDTQFLCQLTIWITAFMLINNLDFWHYLKLMLCLFSQENRLITPLFPVTIKIQSISSRICSFSQPRGEALGRRLEKNDLFCNTSFLS